MCIIIYKPEGVASPSKDILKNCWERNSHGAGVMYRMRRKTYYKKGFMTFAELYQYLSNLNPKHEWGIHFRLATHGGINRECTHPFEYTTSYDQMRKLKGKCDTLVMHNGVFDLKGGTDYSDTMEWVKLMAGVGVNFDSDLHLKLVELTADGQRLLIMGESTTLVGDWVRDNGLYYSNTGYKSTPSFYSKYYKPYVTYTDKLERVIETDKDSKGTEALCEYCGVDCDVRWADEAGMYLCVECCEMFGVTLEELEVDDEIYESETGASVSGFGVDQYGVQSDSRICLPF